MACVTHCRFYPWRPNGPKRNPICCYKNKMMDGTPVPRKTCDVCGWSPEVAERRKKKLRRMEENCSLVEVELAKAARKKFEEDVEAGRVIFLEGGGFCYADDKNETEENDDENS